MKMLFKQIYFKKNWPLLLLVIWVLLTPLLVISAYQRWLMLIGVISIIMILIFISYLVFGIRESVKHRYTDLWR